jgi:hypothetical protein
LLPGTIAGNSMWVGAVVGNARRQKTQCCKALKRTLGRADEVIE